MTRTLQNRLLLLMAALLAATVSGSALAAVTPRDWKTPGDGLLTYDDVNQREWLDLTESRLSQYPGTMFEQRYQNLLLQLAPGGIFEGFLVAQSNDLTALAASGGVNVSSLDDYAQNEFPTKQLMELVGVSTRFQNIDFTQSYGLLDEIFTEGPIDFRLVGVLTSDPSSGPNGQAGIAFSPPDEEDLVTPTVTGVWLYRAVPEPRGLLLWYIGITMMSAWCRRRHLCLSGIAGRLFL